MREFKGDWKDLFNGFVLALDFRKMFLGFLGILLTLLVCGTITFKWAQGFGSVAGPGNLAPHELWECARQCWHVIFTGTEAKPTAPWVGLVYAAMLLVTLLPIWAIFGGAIARIAAYEIARDGERIETAKALKFSWSKFSSFFMAPMICVLGFLFFFACNVAGGALTKLADLIWIGGPLGAVLLPLALLSGFIMVLIAIGSMVGAPLFFPAVAAEGTDSFDAMSRGFSYVYSRPWHFAWYQAVSGVYGWICVAFVLIFTVVMSYLGVRAAATGFDWLAKAWRQENVYGMSIEKGQERAKDLPAFQVPDQPEQPRVTGDSAKDDELSRQYKEAVKQYEAKIDEVVKDPAKLKQVAQRAVLEGDDKNLKFLKTYQQQLEAVDPDLAGIIQEGKAAGRRGDSRLFIINDRVWDFWLSRRHTTTALYRWGPRDLLLHPHPYGRVMFVLNCSITWSLGDHGGGARIVGVPRTLLERSHEELGWGLDMKITYGIVWFWVLLAMGLAYGYAVSYFFSQQTVIYFLLRKKVDGIEMNEVFEEPEEEEPLPEITKPSEPPPEPKEEKPV
jgi:hypothetical protein